MAGSIFRALLDRLMPRPRAASKDQEVTIRGLCVDPRTRHVEPEDLERSASGPGFERLRVGGLPPWADAIARRRKPGDATLSGDERLDPAFDTVASLSAPVETRLALGPSVRRALAEALEHAPAVRLGEGYVEAIVPAAKAGQRAVQDSILTVARAFGGSQDPLDRILRWALEDDHPSLRAPARISFRRKSARARHADAQGDRKGEVAAPRRRRRAFDRGQ